MYLNHPAIVFIGDSPSNYNINSKVPFVGTTSYKRLLEWIYKMDLDFRLCDMKNISDLNDIETSVMHIAVKNKDLCIIALGVNAAKKLQQKGFNNILLLPHPSGRNRLLNNPKYMKKTLTTCKCLIYSTATYMR